MHSRKTYRIFTMKFMNEAPMNPSAFASVKPPYLVLLNHVFTIHTALSAQTASLVSVMPTFWDAQSFPIIWRTDLTGLESIFMLHCAKYERQTVQLKRINNELFKSSKANLRATDHLW